MSDKNTHLIVKPSVKLTKIIEPVIIQLDEYFRAAGLTAYVTSGLRVAEDQLMIIKSYLVRKGLHKKYPEAMTCGVNDTTLLGTEKIYAWQMGWSALLNAGVIINPPLRAKCLMDYFRNEVNKKGKMIDPSPHFNGTALDIGGSGDGIANELAVIQKAVGKVKGMTGYLAERENNCVHIDCK